LKGDTSAYDECAAICPFTNYAVVATDLGIRVIANLVRKASRTPV
jgi:hypothetical protein